MRATLGLLLWAATAIMGVWPVEAGAKDPGPLPASRPDGASKLQGQEYAARLDSCRRKLAPSLEAKLKGLLETRSELRKEYAELREARLASHPDLRKLDAELGAKLAKLRREEGRVDPKARAEVEQGVRKRRALKKSLDGTGELKAMKEQLKGMDAQIQASASEALDGETGCREFQEALTREMDVRGEVQGRDAQAPGNPESGHK